MPDRAALFVCRGDKTHKNQQPYILRVARAGEFGDDSLDLS